MATARNAIELESLVVRLSLDSKAFLANLSTVLGEVKALETVFSNIGGNATNLTNLAGATTSLGNAAPNINLLTKSLGGLMAKITSLNTQTAAITTFGNSMAGLGIQIAQLSGNAANMGTLTTNLGAFVTSLSAMGTNLPPAVGNLSRSLSGIGKFLEATAVVNFTKMAALPRALGRFFARFNKIAANINPDAYVAIGKAMSGLSGLIRAGGSIKDVSGMVNALNSAQGAVDRLVRGVAGVGSAKDLEKGIKGTQAVTSFLRAAGTANATAIGNLVQPVGDFFKMIGNVPFTQIAQASNVLWRLTNSLKGLSAVAPGNVVGMARGVQQAMGILNSITVSQGALQAARVMQQIGGAAKNMAAAGLLGTAGVRGGAGGGKGGGGGFFGNLLGGFASIPPAARDAGNSTRAMAYDLARLEYAGASASTSIFALRYGLLGLGVLGAFQFSQLDDALARAAAHARDFGRVNNDLMTRGVFDVSGKSLSSATANAKALDVLMTAGLNAAGAVNALANAEDFAVASGMDIPEATKKLTDLMHAMDFTGKTAEDFRNNMGQLSDMLVGVARQTGSTEEQMISAFTSRFLTASRVAKIGVQESIAILGVLSRGGEAFRGMKGGNLAARGIEQLSIQSVGGRQQWLAMLGEAAYDTTGQFKPLTELLTLLSEKMAGTGTEKFIAEMHKLGLGGVENLNAIEPLLRAVGGVKDMRAEMERLKGVTGDTANTIRGSFIGQLTVLWNNFSNLANVVGMRLAPMLYAITKPLSEAFFWFVKLNPAMQNLIIIAAALPIAFGPMRWVLMSLISLAISPVVKLYQAFVLVGQAAYNLGYVVGNFVYNAFTNTLSYAVGGVKNLALAFFYVGKATMDVFGSVKDFFMGTVSFTVKIGEFFAYLGKVALAGLVNVLTGVLGLLTSIAGALVAVMVLPIIFAAVAAPIATLIIGVGQLAALIGVGMARAWEAFKSGAASSLTWVASKVADINTGLGRMWSTLKEGLAVAFSNLAVTLTHIAGLLWNFRENARVIFNWIGKFGVRPFEDIMAASFKMVEAVAANFWALTKAIGTSVWSVGMGIFRSLTNIFGAAFTWIRNEFWNMAWDLGVIFGTVMKNVMHNFMILSDAAFAIWGMRVKELMENPMGRTFATKEHAEAFNAAWKATEATEIEQALKKLRGPLDKMDTSKLSTDFESLGVFMAGAFTGPAAKKIWEAVGRDIVTSFSDAFKQMNPILAAFFDLAKSPIWAELGVKLNFATPTLKEAMESFKKAMGIVDKTEMGAGTGPSLENLSGSFSMQQGSMNRFIYQSEELARIDYQQLVELKLLNRNIQMALAQRGVGVDGNKTPPTVIKKMPTLLD